MSAATVTPPSAQPAGPPRLMTADEFMAGPGGELGVDLLDGVVTEVPMPHRYHGVVATRMIREVANFVEDSDIGRVMSNDTHVRVGRNPDRLRGADVLYVSYTHLPRGPFPDGVMDPPFELVVEVRSPSATWADEVRKCFEYLDAGVRVAVLLDIDTQTASVFRTNAVQEVFRAADTLTLPDVLPGFAVPVARLFRV
jgi:Uma2 family endonuclease